MTRAHNPVPPEWGEPMQPAPTPLPRARRVTIRIDGYQFDCSWCGDDVPYYLHAWLTDLLIPAIRKGNVATSIIIGVS